ncbi:MAG: DegV family protein [Peptostreptococcaceae bacterium]|nr:DegV family protein [Peptostreptococcaceae bacterium]
MKKIRIVTDSSCDLPDFIINKYNIGVAYLNVIFGDKAYIDKKEIGADEFYSMMKNSKELPKTSSPSPQRFIKEFEKEESDIIVVCLSSKLSSTHSSALIAKKMYEEDGGKNKIKVIDSLSGSLGMGISILKACRMIESGNTFEEVVDFIQRDLKNSKTYVYLNTLENAVKAGRMSAVKGAIASALNFKFIVKVEDGLVKFVEKARGEKKVLNKVLQRVDTEGDDFKNSIIGIAHSNALEKAEHLKEMLLEKYDLKEIVISKMSSTIGTYTSEGAVLIRF